MEIKGDGGKACDCKNKKIEYMNVRPAIPGHWPYKKLDDGTDDDTVINSFIAKQKKDEMKTPENGFIKYHVW